MKQRVIAIMLASVCACFASSNNWLVINNQLVSIGGSGVAIPIPAAAFSNQYSTFIDGVSDYIDVSNSTDFAINTNGWTLSFWAKTPVSVDTEDLFGYFSTTIPNGYTMRIKNDGNMDFIVRRSGGNYVLTGNSAFDDNTWRHFAVTYLGDALTVYTNASVHTNGTFTITDPGYGNSLQIGKSAPTSGNIGEHYIDEVSIWHVAMDASQIATLYATSDLSTNALFANNKLWLQMGDGDTAPTIIDHSPVATNTATGYNIDQSSFVEDVH